MKAKHKEDGHHCDIGISNKQKTFLVTYKMNGREYYTSIKAYDYLSVVSLYEKRQNYELIDIQLISEN